MLEFRKNHYAELDVGKRSGIKSLIINVAILLPDDHIFVMVGLSG
jgi:hypothetical protein